MELFKIFGTIELKDDKFITKIDEAEKKGKKFGDRLGDLGKKVSDFGQKAGKIGGDLTKKLSLPLIAVGTAGTKMALDVETGIKKITTLADKEILPESKIRKEVKAISNQTGIAQTEISEAIYGALSAGVESEKVLEFVRSGVDLTRAGFTDMETAIDATTTILNAYGDDAFDVSKIHDIFVQTQDKGKISVDELGSSIGRVIPTASSLGINVDELGASYAILTAQGQNAQLATTNLNAMLGEMGKTGSTSDEILRELTGKGFAGLIDDGMSVGEVLGLLDGYAQDNNLSMKDLFGSMNAGSAAVTLLSDGVDGYNSSLDDMNNSTGKTKENAEKTEDGWRKITIATNQMKNALIEFGGMVAPTVEKVADKISELVDWFDGLDDSTKEMIGKATLFVIALGPMMTGISKVIGWGDKLIGNWDKVKGAGKLLFGGLKGTVGFIFSPAGAIMIGIAAVIAIGVLLWKNWDTVKEKATQLWESVTETFNGIKDSVIEKLTVLKEFITNITEATTEFFITAWEYIKIPFAFLWELIKSIVLSAMAVVEGIVGTVLNIIKAVWKTIWNYIGDYVKEVWDKIKEVATNAINKVSEVISLVTSKIKEKWDKIWDAISQFTNKIWNSIKDKIKENVNEILNVVTTIINKVKDKITSIWGSIKETTQRIWNNIKESVSKPINQAKDTVNNTISNMKDRITSIFESIRSTASDLFIRTKEAITKPIEQARDSIGKILDNIKSFFEKMKLKFPKIELPKLPKFSLDGKFSLTPPSVPKLSVKWFAKGGVMQNPTLFGGTGSTLFGGGEAGNEGIVPLEGKHMLPMADAIADRLSGGSGKEVNITQNIYSPDPLTPSEVARRTKNNLRELALDW